MEQVYGQAPEGPDLPGDTATAHARRALRTAGIDDEAIDAGLARWCATFSATYVKLLARADTSHWEIGPGAAEALAKIDRAALLTGNPPAVARARMERLDLNRFFPIGQGAFGCEREDRVALFGLARDRAGGWAPERTAAVGDTPLDVSSAHAAGCRCVAVTTGRYGRSDLRDADAVVKTLHELPAVLERL